MIRRVRSELKIMGGDFLILSAAALRKYFMRNYFMRNSVFKRSDPMYNKSNERR